MVVRGGKNNIRVVDLFCGIGGLTHGMIREGFDVVAGIDNDTSCKYGYERNNNGAVFIDKSILEVNANEIKNLFGDKPGIKVLVGCAPCQPFSKLNQKQITEKQLQPLGKFAELIAEVKPDVVSMENVSGLANIKKYPVFSNFLEALEKNGYQYKYEIVDVSDYGVPQSRKRLVLLASRLGKIGLIKRTHEHNKVTVRDAIHDLPPIQDGEISRSDYLHRSRKLSDKNLRRIKSTPHDGGNSSTWDESLLLECHKKESGQTYKSTVYGRMRWNEPAPTMTTQCIGLGNGRFGHPEQNRAISLREAARFQTFPDTYEFVDPKGEIYNGHVAKFIGNAVPVQLGQVIAKSIKKHLHEYGRV